MGALRVGLEARYKRSVLMELVMVSSKITNGFRRLAWGFRLHAKAFVPSSPKLVL